MESLEILERGGNALVLIPTKRDGAADGGTVEAFGAVDNAAQLIEGSDSDLIEVTVSQGRSFRSSSDSSCGPSRCRPRPGARPFGSDEEFEH
jgi:hypothetical protein